MQPFEGFPGGMTSISLAEEIEEIKRRLIAMGEVVTHAHNAVNGFTEVDNPIAPYKVKRAKKRKQKRKNGGPR